MDVPTKETISKSYLAIEYVLSDFADKKSVKNALTSLAKLAAQSNGKNALDDFPVQCNADQITELLVVCCPNNVGLQDTTDVIISFFEACLDAKGEFSLDDLPEIPEIMAQAFLLRNDEIYQSAERALDYAETKASKYSYPIGSDSGAWTHEYFESLFTSFCKARVLKHNAMQRNYTVSHRELAQISSSPFFSQELRNWFEGFYKPLSALSKCTEVPPFADFDTYLSPTDQMNMIMDAAVSHNRYAQVFSSTLLPYLKYKPQAWSDFNDWLIRRGDKTIQLTDEKRLISEYKVLLEIVRQDKVLKAISQHKKMQDKFVSVLISIIYLCPKPILEVFVDANEMFVSIGALPLDAGSKKDIHIPEPQSTIEKMYLDIPPTKTFLKKCSESIETGERLYSNGLSLVQIVSLEFSDSQTQLAELKKFIDNESKYGKNSKQWETLLSSIYWIFKNTDIFAKIDINTLDEMILAKLLDMKYFSIASDLFLPRFCSLPPEKSQSIIMRYAWMYYKRATNCDPTIGSLKCSVECVSMAQEKDQDVAKLQNLISANKAVLHWKLSFKTGVPMTPKQILEVDDPNKVIYRILELNDDSYKDYNALFDLMRYLIIGLDCYDKEPVFEYAKDDEHELNPLLARVKLICLDFASPIDLEFAYELSTDLLNQAIENKQKAPKLFAVVCDHWLSIFQFVKNEINTPTIEGLDRKMALLGELILVTPTEFNIPVLEQWQIMNSEKVQLSQDLKEEAIQSQKSTGKLHIAPALSAAAIPNFLQSAGIDDLRSRLQTSLESSAKDLKSSANDLLKNADAGDIGRNIIGRIVGAQ